MRSVSKSFYNSKDWKLCSRQYLQSVNHWCERCKARGIYEPARVVHHKIWLSEDNYKDPAISLNFDNLEALCQTCHNQEHFGDDTPRRYEITPDGRLIF